MVLLSGVGRVGTGDSSQQRQTIRDASPTKPRDCTQRRDRGKATCPDTATWLVSCCSQNTRQSVSVEWRPLQKGSGVRVLVLGAGVVGTACAWYLRDAGHEVTVVDRQAGAARETSLANGGQISTSHSEPWANPGAPRRILGWLGREEAPLLFRPRLDLQQWLWSLAFLRECLPARTAANIRSIVRLALHSRAELQALRTRLSLDYDCVQRGILHFYTDRAEFEVAAGRWMREPGCDRRSIPPTGGRTRTRAVIDRGRDRRRRLLRRRRIGRCARIHDTTARSGAKSSFDSTRSHGCSRRAALHDRGVDPEAGRCDRRRCGGRGARRGFDRCCGGSASGCWSTRQAIQRRSRLCTDRAPTSAY
jgi:hypothetical protein